MKKQILIILGCFLILTGCNSKDIKDFTLTTNSSEYKLDNIYEENIENPSNSSFESENCALGNKNIVYLYDHYQIETYEKDNKMYIYSIYFLDENIKTNEGIKIYDSYDSMIEAYGEDYQKYDNCYTYTRNNTQLIFILQNNNIISIEYRLTDV